MQLDVLSKKITTAYINNNVDMNASIAKVASETNLNIEETKRLVEECNKACYLTKMAQTGEQVFDIADYEKIKSIVKTPTMTKKASVTFENTNYDIFDSLEKTASINTPSFKDFNEAIDRCNAEAGKHLTKFADLSKMAEYKMPGCGGASEIELYNMTKNTPLEKLAGEILEEIRQINKFHQMKENLLEKRAGIVSGIAGATLKGGAQIVSKVGGTVIKHPFNAGLVPLGLVSAGVTGVKKAKDGLNQTELSNISKTAALSGTLGERILEVAEGALPYAALAGMIGVGSAAARGMGGMVSRMMTQKQLDSSFDTAMAANKDLRDIPNARDYFNVVARHSPSLANDPMVAPQIMRQFDSFGGVDVKTVQMLRDIENSNGGSRGNDQSFDMLGTMSSLKGYGKDRFDTAKSRSSFFELQNKHVMGIANGENNKWSNTIGIGPKHAKDVPTKPSFDELQQKHDIIGNKTLPKLQKRKY